MKIVGQGAGQRPDQVPAPILPELDIEDIHLQHVTGFGIGQPQSGRSKYDPAPSARSGMNIGKFGRDVKLGIVRDHFGAAGDGIDRDFIAAGDGHDRLQPGFKKAPVAGFGAGMQVMMGHEEAFLPALF